MDLNIDLGEHETPAERKALLSAATSANIAAGVHAGSEDIARECLRLCREQGTRAGVHPGAPGAMGRGPAPVTMSEFLALVQPQMLAMAGWAAAEGISLHHVKLHGSLYHATDADPVLAAGWIAHLRAHWPQLVLFARSGGVTATEAERAGQPVWREVFAERGYRPDGSLIARCETGALLSPEQALARWRAGQLPAGETLCVHADSHGAVALALALREELDAAKSLASTVGAEHDKAVTSA